VSSVFVCTGFFHSRWLRTTKNKHAIHKYSFVWILWAKCISLQQNCTSVPLTAEELSASDTIICPWVQQEAFDKEISFLKAKKQISKGSSIYVFTISVYRTRWSTPLSRPYRRSITSPKTITTTNSHAQKPLYFGLNIATFPRRFAKSELDCYHKSMSMSIEELQ